MTDIFSLCERDKPEEVAAMLKADADLVDETDSVSYWLVLCVIRYWSTSFQDQVSLQWQIDNSN